MTIDNQPLVDECILNSFFSGVNAEQNVVCTVCYRGFVEILGGNRDLSSAKYVVDFVVSHAVSDDSVVEDLPAVDVTGVSELPPRTVRGACDRLVVHVPAVGDDADTALVVNLIEIPLDVAGPIPCERIINWCCEEKGQDVLENGASVVLRELCDDFLAANYNHARLVSSGLGFSNSSK